jgi:hypothetical protein
MSPLPDEPALAGSRRQIAAEVLELGEALFDAAIDAATGGQLAAATDEPSPEAELRAAAEEFFTALRLLLGLELGEDAAAPGEAAALPTPAGPEGDEGYA